MGTSILGSVQELDFTASDVQNITGMINDVLCLGEVLIGLIDEAVVCLEEQAVLNALFLVGHIEANIVEVGEVVDDTLQVKLLVGNIAQLFDLAAVDQQVSSGDVVIVCVGHHPVNLRLLVLGRLVLF